MLCPAGLIGFLLSGLSTESKKIKINLCALCALSKAGGEKTRIFTAKDVISKNTEITPEAQRTRREKKIGGVFNRRRKTDKGQIRLNLFPARPERGKNVITA